MYTIVNQLSGQFYFKPYGVLQFVLSLSPNTGKYGPEKTP